MMSSYVESIIGSGEKIEYEAKISIWSLLPLILWGLFFFWLGLYFSLLFGLGLMLICWMIAIIRYITTELTVTNKKIIAKFGFIRRDTIELLLPKVESIQVNQSIMGRMLNYGSVVASGAGNPQAPIRGISSPMEFRRIFMEIQERATSNA